jgi:2-polyprenyl-6-methoxyphenol hydroxylase-like FAD-dependent oxidoreductase
MKVIIIGGGIGGIATALMLHQRGVDCEVFEQSEEVRELGVGLTLLPHAVKQLVHLDLLDAMDKVAIRSEHLRYLTRRGQGVWDEPRGLLAGYDVPQFFMHRGKLQMLLYNALRERLPTSAIHLDRRLVEFTQDENGVNATFSDRRGNFYTTHGDLLIGADGIHSTVRSALFPDQGTPRWSGLMLWRGATDWPEFLGGATVMIHGGVDTKFVCYPIAPGSKPGNKLTNWAAIIRLAPDDSQPPSRENWSKVGKRSELLPYLDRFSSDTIDFRGLVDATETFWEYPMCDRDPIDNWTSGRVTLLGDAAHPMYPMGANGASQAILDARSLTDELASDVDLATALANYQAERLPKTSAIVHLNRKGGPEAVIDAVETRAPNGFDDIDAVMGRDERQAFMSNYAQNAGYSKAQVARG